MKAWKRPGLELTLHFLPLATQTRRQSTRRPPFSLEGPLKLHVMCLLVLLLLLMLLVIIRRDSRCQRCAIHVDTGDSLLSLLPRHTNSGLIYEVRLIGDFGIWIAEK